MTLGLSRSYKDYVKLILDNDLCRLYIKDVWESRHKLSYTQTEGDGTKRDMLWWDKLNRCYLLGND